MAGNNMSEWIAEAAKFGRDLRHLRQDKTKIYDFLAEKGLPHPRRLTVDGACIDYSATDAFTVKHGIVFCRLIPKEEGALRPYRSNVSSPEALREFFSEHELDQYTVQVVENGNVTHMGAIIARNTGDIGCIVEILEGDGPKLFHGESDQVVTAHVRKNPFPSDPFTLFPPFLSTYQYSPRRRQPTEIERAAVKCAVEWIGGPVRPYAGYFEFQIRNHNPEDILFRNYQPPESGFARSCSKLFEKC